MITEIAAALSATKQTFELSKTVLQFTEDHKARTAVIDLQQAILDLQSKLGDVQVKYAELAEKNLSLQKQLSEQNEWEAESKRYQLVALGENIFAYALREDLSDGEPPHMLCHPCFHQKKRSILDRGTVNRSLLKCPACKFEICLTKETWPTAASIPGRLHRSRNMNGLI